MLTPEQFSRTLTLLVFAPLVLGVVMVVVILAVAPASAPTLIATTQAHPAAMRTALAE